MRHIIKGRLIWIFTVCKCMSEFTQCPTLPDFTLMFLPRLEHVLSTLLIANEVSVSADVFEVSV